MAKSPTQNPFGVDEEPSKFVDFDIFTKLKVLVQLSVWTLNNAERIREKMEERGEQEQSVAWVRSLSLCHKTLIHQCQNFSVSMKSDTTERIVTTSYWTTTAYTVVPNCLRHPPILQSQKLKLRELRR